MSLMYENFSLPVKVQEGKYFDRNLVNSSRELMEPMILMYDCSFILEKQFHI